MRGRHTAAATALRAFMAAVMPALMRARVAARMLALMPAVMLAVIALVPPSLAWAQAETEPPTWIATKDGLPFRVRFDPDHRLFVGVFTDLRSRDGGGTPTPGFEMGLLLRSPTPDAHWAAFWD